MGLGNCATLFEILLNYTFTDKTKWPENRTLPVFGSWFNLYRGDLILDLKTSLIKIN